MMLHRRDLIGGKKPRIPSAYEELAYVVSNGKQWVDTGVLAKDIYFYEDKVDSTAGLYGAGSNDALADGAFCFGFSSERITFKIGTSGWISTGSNQIEQSIDVSAKINIVNGNSIPFSGALNRNLNLFFFLFNRYRDNTARGDRMGGRILLREGFVSKYYYCRIYGIGKTLMREYVPCKRKSDGVVGLYELVQSEFKPSEGDEPFAET